MRLYGRGEHLVQQSVLRHEAVDVCARAFGRPDRRLADSRVHEQRAVDGRLQENLVVPPEKLPDAFWG